MLFFDLLTPETLLRLNLEPWKLVWTSGELHSFFSKKIVKIGQNLGAQNLKTIFLPSNKIVLTILQPRSQCKQLGFFLKIVQYQH